MMKIFRFNGVSMNIYKGLAGKPYMPSNGTEGMYFTSEFCDNCIYEHPDSSNELKCWDVLYKSLCGEQPEEWIYNENDEPICIKFVKWDWGRDDDPDGWNEPPPPEPTNPNQLLMPFGFEELFPMLFGEDVVVTKYAILELSN